MQNNICKVSCKYKNKTHTYSVQFRPSVVSDSLRPHVLQHTRPPRPVTNSRSPPKPMSIESVMPSSHLILCCPLLLLPSTFPSIRVFSNASALLIRWPKCWSFSFNISPSNEHPGLISFRMDWLDLLAVQGTLKSLLQHHSSKESILWRSAFFIGQLSHPYMTTGKTIALTRQTFVDKVTSLLLNMLSRLVITFLPRSSSVQSLSHVQLFATPSITARQASLSITNSRSPPKPMAIVSVMLCHPTISSSVVPFSSCPQSFPASGPFQMSQLCKSGGQSIEVSTSASVLPMHIQD